LAFKWLVDHKYFHLAAIDSILDGSQSARTWLRKYNFEDLVYLADAIKQDSFAINWLKERNLDIYIFIAKKIEVYLNSKKNNPLKFNF
jgi:hypothetical protein